MALSGLDIYKLLPKTNCRECGFVTCLAFAMQLAKKAVSIDKCPYLSKESKEALNAQAQPPIKLVTIGSGEEKLEIGNESVLFRHEEKFYRPCGIGFILEDTLPEAKIKENISRINGLSFERVGQQLSVNLIAIKYSNQDKFVNAVKLALANTKLGLVLVCDDPLVLKAALEISQERRPLIFGANINNLAQIAGLAKEYNLPLVVSANDLSAAAELTKQLNSQGINGLVIEITQKPVASRLWDLTQIRRQALKKSNRALGYPLLVAIDQSDQFEEIMEAATYIVKYASIVLLKGLENWQALALLTLRQNIYTDPQKPLQIEPKIYPIGAVHDKSPVLITTNFSLSYYTVLSEVEASKVPAYIVSVDTEGMSVLTAWAAEKFTPEKISESLDKFGLKDLVSHKKLIIPGYVAMLSGELEDKTGSEIIVGPKEAAGIPSFLKNL